MNWAHVHLAINHAPVIGSLAVFLLLGAGLAFRSRDVVRAALAGFVVVGVLAVGVYLTGEPAEEVVEGQAGVSEAPIEAHEEAALAATIALGAMAVVSLAGLFAYRPPRELPRRLGVLLLIVSLGPVIAMAWTANLGGRIHHPEISPAAAPAASTAEPASNGDD